MKMDPVVPLEPDVPLPEPEPLPRMDPEPLPLDPESLLLDPSGVLKLPDSLPPSVLEELDGPPHAAMQSEPTTSHVHPSLILLPIAFLRRSRQSQAPPCLPTSSAQQYQL
jgi:hypothetical protein